LATIEPLTTLISPEDWLLMAGSAAVVVFMVAVGALLGFRQRVRIDETRLRALAAAEGQGVRQTLVAPRGDAGIAWLMDGRVLAARVTADGVGVRVVSEGQVTVRGRRVRAVSNDLGFPSIDLKIGAEPPAWLAELARG
jgi:hypothetical protein